MDHSILVVIAVDEPHVNFKCPKVSEYYIEVTIHYICQMLQKLSQEFALDNLSLQFAEVLYIAEF